LNSHDNNRNKVEKRTSATITMEAIFRERRHKQRDNWNTKWMRLPK